MKANTAPCEADGLTPPRSKDARPLLQIEPVADLLRRFPSTRYYGSKRRLLTWMYGHLGSIRFDTVLDAFGGTGSVSLLFRAMRKQVTYHDAFRFNEDVAHTVLSDHVMLTREEITNVLLRIEPVQGTISKHFSGTFFKDAENAWLDGFMALLHNEPIAPEAKALLRYLVYQACLKKRPFNLFHRANLGLRTNETVDRSFGNAVTWERTFDHHALQAYDELQRLTLRNGKPITVLPAGDASDISPGYDMVYIDPPYLHLEDRYNRDDYWRRYHFLEGLARYQKWGSQIDPQSDIGLFPAPIWFSLWGRKASFRERLFDFIDKHRNSIVVLSYVSGAYPSEAETKSHFEDRFRQVSIHSAPHHHALSKTRKRELLIIGHPR